MKFLTDYTAVTFTGIEKAFNVYSTFVEFTIPFVNIDVSIKFYGLIIAFGFLLAVLFGGRMAYKWKIDLNKMLDVLLYGTIGGIIGARLYYVLFEWDYYSHHLSEIPKIWNGGLAIYGGLIGAILVAYFTCRKIDLNFLKLLDMCGMSFLIGQGIGRWGNFMNQEAYGSPTDLPWRMMSEGTDNIGVHPCFFYESMWCLLGFVLLHFYGKYKQKYSGQIFFMYLVWYGFERTIVEGLRTDSLYLPFQVFGADIRVSQVLSAVIFIIGIVFLIINRKKEDSFYADYRRKKGIGTGKGRGKEADA